MLIEECIKYKDQYKDHDYNHGGLENDSLNVQNGSLSKT